MAETSDLMRAQRHEPIHRIQNERSWAVFFKDQTWFLLFNFTPWRVD
jgi:hypothetical protein